MIDAGIQNARIDQLEKELAIKNRELEIEAALEKVRSCTMAMQQSADLLQVTNVVSEQLQQLGFIADAASFITDSDEKGYNLWLASPGDAFLSKIYLPRIDDKVNRIHLGAIAQGKSFYTYVLSKEEKDEFFLNFFGNTRLNDSTADIKQQPVFQAPGMAAAVCLMDTITLTVSNFQAIPYGEADNNILKRFAFVFEQSYRRFLDLQKAEAQAGEAKIQLALERVRARTMAMQKSDELREVVGIVFQQMKKLGYELTLCNIILFDSETLEPDYWVSFDEQNVLPESYHIPFFDHPVYHYQVNAWKEAKRFDAFELSGPGKTIWDRYLIEQTDIKKIPQSIKDIMGKLEKVFLSSVAMKHGLFQVANINPLSHENISILQRFSKVFEQTYTRFLDLQKAEAQAREAQIELGLERVRARAMAMQKSDELSELVDIVFKELTKLDFALNWCIINIIDESTMSNTVWAANPDISKAPESYHMLFEDYPFHHAMMKGWKERRAKDVYVLEGEEKKVYDEYLFNETEFRRVPAEAQAASRAMKKYVVSFTFSNFGGLQTVGEVPLSDANIDILSRFGKVFDLTYTRFNDLQKAELQAREAKIEAALERTRTQSMLMQHSSELSETLQVFHHQLQLLGIDSDFSYLWLPNEEKDEHVFWATWEEDLPAGTEGQAGTRSIQTKTLTYPLDRSEAYTAVCLKDWKSGIPVHTYNLGAAEVENYFAAWQELLSGSARLKPEFFPDGFSYVETFMKYGCFGIVNTRSLTHDEKEILRRITIEFERTYTRFLDLQKAEAQAREAKIEAALERVRSRAMAMHKTDELLEAADLVYKELTALGVTSMNISYAFVDEEERSGSYYSINPVDGKTLPFPFVFPHTETEVMRSILHSWKQQEPFHKIELEEEATLKHQTYIGEHIQRVMQKNNIPFTVEAFLAVSPQKAKIYTFNFSRGYLFNIGGSLLTTEQEDMILRFTKVFDLTYRRFLDIQKAEAQAREAQVELALERVRARTMAMQKSDELTDVAGLLFDQVTALGIKTWTAGFNVWSDDNNSYVDYITSPNGGFIEPYTVYTEMAEALTDISTARKSGVEFDVQYVEGEKIIQLYRALTKIDEKQYEVMLKDGLRFPSHQYEHFVFGSKVSLMFITYEPVPEAHDVFKRLGKVFEQTYTRFLDLKNAEAQTRESQIQLALERVRARTMAMQKSDELAETASLLFAQIESLGIETWTSGFNIWEKDDQFFIGYNPTPAGGITTPYRIASTDDPFFLRIYEAKKAGEEFIVFDSGGESLAATYRYMKTLPVVKDVLENIESSGFLLPTFQINHCAFFSHGFLLFITLEPFPEAHTIFNRFAKVFEQTYTRFLDLQKAEALARESQIQLALERIRARTMAMYKSEELAEVVKMIYQEFEKLKINNESTDIEIGLINGDTGVASMWAHFYKSDGSISTFNFPLTHFPVIRDEFIRWKNTPEHLRKQIFTTTVIENELLDEFMDAAQAEDDLRDIFQPMIEAGITRWVTHNVYFSHGIVTLQGTDHYSSETIEILRRFTIVFEQTYTRFLDLKNAEAQTRESQIQLALERVRARTMAMYKSEDLGAVAAELFNELKKFGGNIATGGFVLCDRNKTDDEYWVCWESGVLPPMLVPHTTDPVCINLYKGWESGKEFYAEERSGEELKAHFDYMLSVPTTRPVFEKWLELAGSFPEWQRWHAAYFKYGFVFVITVEPYAEEQLFKRFAPVFEQTYTRFLDLQKAEEQAREAQIELALERVRAKTMAMQKSDELREAVLVIYEQLQNLGFDSNACNIIIIDKESGDMQYWVSGFTHEIFPEGYQVPYLNHSYHDELLAASRQNKEYYLMEYSGEMKQSFDELFFTQTDFRKIPEEAKNFMRSLEFVKLSTAFFTNGALQVIGPSELSADRVKILQRFAKVFDLTYTRFNDLQKAEAQVKEARIETALERIRAVAMAMKQSEELTSICEVMYKELIALGFTNIRNAQIAINVETYLSWLIFEYSDYGSISKKKVDVSDGNVSPLLQEIAIEIAKSKDALFQKQITGKEFEAWRTWRIETDALDDPRVKNANSMCFYLYAIQSGLLGISTLDKISDQQIQILKRFKNVFELSYTRFDDLQKAEVQARESQIQLALERVRARTMAMQHSSELQDAAILLFSQINSLGVPTGSCGFNIWENEKTETTVWMSSPEGGLQAPFQMPHTESPIYQQVYSAANNGDELLIKEVSGDELKRHFDYLVTLPVIGDIVTKLRESGYHFPGKIIYHFAFFAQGYLSLHVHETMPEVGEIFKRFARVFEQTYTRFLDLQKAEAQARESQIQLALERVRARTMAMQKSEELASVATVLFQQVKALGVTQWVCGFSIFEIGDKECTWYPGSPDGDILTPCRVPLTEHPVFIQYNESRKRGDELYVYEKTGEFQAGHYRYMQTIPGMRKLLQNMLDAGLKIPEFQIDHIANFSHGNLVFITYEHVPEMHDIFKRFAQVFDQTYTRFLDLQKAEAQAREAKIETALEKVRARTMAMQHSSELLETSHLLDQQVRELGISTFGCAFNIFDEGQESSTEWFSNAKGYRSTYKLPRQGVFLKYYQEAKKGTLLHVEEFSAEACAAHYRFLSTLPGLSEELKFYAESAVQLPEIQFDNVAYFKYGYVLFVTYDQVPEAYDIFKRFAKVFEQTYTRFLDLQKAEAQARESQVEAALERVRSRTMGMRHSSELQDAASLMVEQIQSLGVPQFASGFNIWDEDRKAATAWMSNATTENRPPPFKTSSADDIFFDIHEAAQRGESLFVKEQSGNELKTHYEYMHSIPVFKAYVEKASPEGLFIPDFQIMHCAFFAQGYLMFITYEPVPQAYDIFKRFAKVFEQTYTRFLDLKNAEALALETVKRASVDRVRAEIASMRTTGDLERITPLIWNELSTLGVPFIRCGVFIMDEEKQEVQTMLSTPDGKAIATLHVPFDFELSIIINGVKYWRKKEIYKEYWDAAEFTKVWIRLSSLRETHMETSQTVHAPDNLFLHMLPFLQGMLYVGSEATLNEDELHLAQNLADAFSTAYARYEDFNKLEAAKKQVDSTLNELQATQKQLIQSEKMASLGELTAGIAHEIQNPLNFVNNFSEISAELIEEARGKRQEAKENSPEVAELLMDIKQNLEKINHHGKRADSIVKGMLQHSRSSSTVKESTDINALADEYLRLAYHGVRAKDKSFNAILETDFDETIGRINVIPQDIGRLLLNLYNNAFYAVSVKSGRDAMFGVSRTTTDESTFANATGDKYHPQVSVTTRKAGNQVEITVKDNGNGIPQKVIDKIFQPFFTTKPTGQGTGLGLSLAYDIVKAHNGELKVNSIECEGSEFIITLNETT